MTPVNLVKYSQAEMKIPSEFLGPSADMQPPITTFQKLTSYFLDAVAISTLAGTFSMIIAVSFKQLFMSQSLKSHFHQINFADLTMMFMPLFFVSYFFFSFFFNHGQTWGMKVTKTRIEMKEMNFRSSLFWALYSATVVMSAGISYFLSYNRIKNKGWGDFQGHDHLYLKLVQTKVVVPVSIVAPLQNSSESEAEENYYKAA
jgi:hypothetical protein